MRQVARRSRSVPSGLIAYIFALVVSYVVVLVLLLPSVDVGRNLWELIALTALLAATERAALSFHEQHAEFSLSAAEAVLLVMFTSLSVGAVLAAVTLAHVVARLPRWRRSALKESFNLAQYTLSAVVAAALYEQLGGTTGTFTGTNAATAALVVVVFALLTHSFVSIAVAITERQPFLAVTREVAPATLLNLVLSIVVGLLFSASFHASRWTIALFPFVLATLYLGYRAVLRQQSERRRVEFLHAASRVLASSPDLSGALIGFLRAVTEIVSAVEARVVIQGEGRATWSGTRRGSVIADTVPLAGGPMQRLLETVTADGHARVVDQDRAGDAADLLSELGARSLLAVRLVDKDRVIGCLAVFDRLGPEGFGEADRQLLEALGSELVVTLDSHRLFHEVAEERQRFGRIFHGSKEGICLLDSEGVVRAWNPALERITGYLSADVMGSVWSNRVMIRDGDQHRVEGTALVGQPSDAVLEVVTRDGPTRWISVISGPVQSEADAGGWVVLVRDVTAEHEVEKAKSDFLSTISHELRTPLTTIKGSLQVLGRGTENLPPDLTEQMIGVTTRGAERLERLVMNLLMVSQIESGVMPVFTEEISMSEVVKDRVASILRDHAEVDLEVEAKEMHVRADRERLSQVVEHLLDNALKFGGPQGKITVSLNSSNGYAHLSVTDEGPGIPSADHERIFERFIRLGDVLTRETQGAGVGLFIAKSAVELMDGHIWVDSEPGKGATFHVEIPLARPVAVKQAEGA